MRGRIYCLSRRCRRRHRHQQQRNNNIINSRSITIIIIIIITIIILDRYLKTNLTSTNRYEIIIDTSWQCTTPATAYNKRLKLYWTTECCAQYSQVRNDIFSADPLQNLWYRRT